MTRVVAAPIGQRTDAPARRAEGMCRGRSRRGVPDEGLPPREVMPARAEERPQPGRTPRSDGAGGGRLTLGELIAGAWEDLLAAGSATCPVCRDSMEWRGGAARCDRCGAGLE